MKVYINQDQNGNVTGYFQCEQYPGQKQADTKEAIVSTYAVAKSARISAVTIVDRIAKIEADLTAVKEATIAK